MRDKDDEIEITPEMIEAGLQQLAGFDANEDNHGECARAIFIAMVRAGTKRRQIP